MSDSEQTPSHPRGIMSMLRIMDRFNKWRGGRRGRNGSDPDRIVPAETASLTKALWPQQEIPAAARYGFDAKVLLTRNGCLLAGRITNISATGMYVVVEEHPFDLRDKLHVSIWPEGSGRAFNTVATVVRATEDAGPHQPQGYGLKFSTLHQ